MAYIGSSCKIPLLQSKLPFSKSQHRLMKTPNRYTACQGASFWPTTRTRFVPSRKPIPVNERTSALKVCSSPLCSAGVVFDLSGHRNSIRMCLCCTASTEVNSIFPSVHFFSCRLIRRPSSVAVTAQRDFQASDKPWMAIGVPMRATDTIDVYSENTADLLDIYSPADNAIVPPSCPDRLAPGSSSDPRAHGVETQSHSSGCGLRLAPMAPADHAFRRRYDDPYICGSIKICCEIGKWAEKPSVSWFEENENTENDRPSTTGFKAK
ncbi:hypothetical protein CEXT_470721 [Caerostris extrusa]|uniref:Uncharacterized protein n=1 Tax=Caerostris extrusa TaxID=172846 RepID=A0AAV4TYB4_CAEEX|nr:hypothetical protein CEXT_470721 [Caerostris extrusa]